MSPPNWMMQFPASITICDPAGVLMEMNDRAAEVFGPDGGRALIGHNILDCHPEPARTKTQHLLESRASNVYTIEKDGVRKLIYQAPWYVDGEFAGLVELAIEMPAEMPHFVRS